MKDFEEKLNKLYLAYLEEKCHIHPTAEVTFEEDDDTDGGVIERVIIGGFDCGLSFTDTDVLVWMIESDIKPSEVKDYSKDYWDNLLQINSATDIATVHDVSDYTKIKCEANKVEDFVATVDSEFTFLKNEKIKQGGGSFEYNNLLYDVSADGLLTYLGQTETEKQK